MSLTDLLQLENVKPCPKEMKCDVELSTFAIRDGEEYKNFCDRPKDQRPQAEEVIGVCRRKILSVGGEYNMVRGVSGANGPFLCLSMWTCISCPMPDCPRYEVYRSNSKKDIQKFLKKDTKS